MNYIKNILKSRIIALIIITSILMSILFSGYNNVIAKADAGTEYYKYNMTTALTTTYTLPVIPSYMPTYYNMASTYLDDDTRENAPLEQSVVLLNPSLNGITKLGTGFIIGDHEIMTAAHCVYEDGKFADHITIKLPTNNPANEGSYISLTATNLHVPKLYTNDVLGNDYAIITVEENLSNYGSVFLGIPTSDIVDNNVTIHNLGYNGYAYLKIDDGKAYSIIENGNLLYSNLISKGGTSGGPVYVQSTFGNSNETSGSFTMQTYKTVVGIVSRAGENITEATCIRPQILQFAYNNSNL